MEPGYDSTPSNFPSRPPTRHMSTPSEQTNREQHDLPQRMDSTPNFSYEKHNNYYEAPKTNQADLPKKLRGAIIFQLKVKHNKRYRGPKTPVQRNLRCSLSTRESIHPGKTRA